MKLTVGKKTNKDLAMWFGLKENSFRSHKAEKLEELKKFANYYEEKGKVIITEVFIEEYSKNASENYQLICNNLDEVWSKDGLDSCSNVANKMYKELKNEIEIKPSTVYKYAIWSRNELYGKPFQEPGTLGSCIYLWCKKIENEDGVSYQMLTAEEEKIKKELIRKYFGDTTEKQIIVKGMVETGEIKKEEAWEVLESFTGMDNNSAFLLFLGELQAKIGCQVIKGTLVNRNFISAF